jgi:hypothetical protein
MLRKVRRGERRPSAKTLSAITAALPQTLDEAEDRAWARCDTDNGESPGRAPPTRRRAASGSATPLKSDGELNIQERPRSGFETLGTLLMLEGAASDKARNTWHTILGSAGPPQTPAAPLTGMRLPLFCLTRPRARLQDGGAVLQR